MGGDIVGATPRIQRVPWAVTETVAGETVLLDPVGDRYLRLNASGAVLWELLAEPRALDDLARALADRHALDEAVAARDAGAFLDALRTRELVQDV
jgi:aminoglycoside phosphotransferase (APT) family kinase protein